MKTRSVRKAMKEAERLYQESLVRVEQRARDLEIIEQTERSLWSGDLGGLHETFWRHVDYDERV